ncbi:hypothetical protein OE699_10090 [Sedimentimonas flavescens]|uniref:Glycosyltransferase involved in cell wall biosynthesis n=1 Tax=Sedimentimonas flavescens TaxID=2851012 RepID=A0ABT2ZZN1_9RHOB|nr:hypothetical protein [Sedimentimonas flavescens]MCV2879206.1 hypothetical protein [Sedimentimonas flavescens]
MNKVKVPGKFPRDFSIGAPMLSTLSRLFLKDYPALDPDTFVLWEPCTKSHAEIVPGYASYLLSLGYKVLVLVTPTHLSGGLFSRFRHPQLSFSNLSQRQIRKFMRRADIAAAAGVMISTAGKLPETHTNDIDLDAVFGVGRRPRRLLLVEHDIRRQTESGDRDSNPITLRAFPEADFKTVVVNPHDFGRTKLHEKTPGKTYFVMVGASRSKRRNQSIVYEAFSRLVADGTKNFELRLIGKPGKEEVPGQLAPYVKVLGRLGFSRLYEEIENADFLITAFQAENPEHSPYRESKTSGSFQLCYGFSKPCIVQREFAVGTALSASNSLFYGADEEMAVAISRAIHMPETDYALMRDTMSENAKELALQSLANLKALIDA